MLYRPLMLMLRILCLAVVGTASLWAGEYPASLKQDSNVARLPIRCLGHLTGRPHLSNEQIPFYGYHGVVWRNYAELANAFGPGFSSFIDSNPKAPVLLPGGGMGIYGIELARRGHFVAQINPQNFLGDQVGALLDERVLRYFLPNEFRIRDRTFETIGTVRVNALNRLAKALQVPFPKSIDPPQIFESVPVQRETWKLRESTTLVDFEREISAFVSSIFEAAKSGGGGGVFALWIGTVQNNVEEFPDQSFGVIADHLDAFTYSSDRLHLIEKYYSKLAPGGRAYIMIDGLGDFVRLQKAESKIALQEFSRPHGGSLVRLTDYLSYRYPQVFQRYVHNIKLGSDYPEVGNKAGDSAPVKVLVIARPHGGPEKLDFSELREGETWVFDRPHGMEIPAVEYTQQP